MGRKMEVRVGGAGGGRAGRWRQRRVGRASLAASRGTSSKKSMHQYGVARVADGPAHRQTYGAQSSSFAHGGGGPGGELPTVPIRPGTNTLNSHSDGTL